MEYEVFHFGAIIEFNDSVRTEDIFWGIAMTNTDLFLLWLDEQIELTAAR